MNRDALTDIFRNIGAEDSESWANSQIDEGIPQLHRYLFLRQAWSNIVSPDNSTWADGLMSSVDRPDVYGKAAKALKALLNDGCDQSNLTAVVRAMQAELLSSIFYQLEDPDISGAETEFIDWGLFACDERGVPGVRIGMLHESVLETDPYRDIT